MQEGWKMNNKLDGKWLLICCDEYYLIGKIICEPVDGYYLVQIKPHEGPPTQRLFGIEELLNGQGSVIFKDEAELKNYFAWLDAPNEARAKAKVIHINPKGNSS